MFRLYKTYSQGFQSWAVVISCPGSAFTIFTKNLGIDIFICMFSVWEPHKEELLEFTHIFPSTLEVPRKIAFNQVDFKY